MRDAHLSRRAAAVCLAAAGLSFAIGCVSRDRLATRILEEYRRASGVRPLPGSQVIRLELSSRASPARGTHQIEWDPQRYRETVSSAGFTTVRGIQGGKAYFTDEDGITRVVSEPILAELLTRSYFWRRAYLFEDAERAKISLGPATASEVSVRLLVKGGNPLLLTFARKGMRLMSARSAGLVLDFDSGTRWRDSSRRGMPVDVEQKGTNLPTDTLQDAAVGGWTGSWSAGSSAEAPFLPARPEVAAVRASVAGREWNLAVDGEVEGPVRLRKSPAGSLPLFWTTDVFGRRLARGARFAVGTWSEPSICVEASDSIPEGADAAAGGALFREAIVEYDREGRRLRVHDPEKWVRPEGYYRAVLDDDENRPVAIVNHRKEILRLLTAVPVPEAIAVSPASADRAGLPEPPAQGAASASGLRWGPFSLPPLDFVRHPEAFDPESGDDGRLSTAVLIRFSSILDMTHRWAYLKPEGGDGSR
ncbi:MAG TPA: hypothetical protein VE007_02745 [Thermoanaerobaculia bacterium]|nr:hypothetical protein [Thermoanaerobaculia bacterium]